MIEICSNGCNTRRSLSPVMIQSACPDSANSRYLLSFGSRQTFRLWDTGSILLEASTSNMNSRRGSSEIYLSNLGLRIILCNSARIAFQEMIWSFLLAISHALRGRLSLRMTALTSTLLSKITTTYLLSSSISLRILSRISGVMPFLLASSLISSIISSRPLRSFTIRLNVLTTACFSIGVIWLILSATASLTSSVMVFILLQFTYTNIAN